MPNLNERVELYDMICPYCHEKGSFLMMYTSGELMRRFETAKGPFYVHVKCGDHIIHEWIEKHEKAHR